MPTTALATLSVHAKAPRRFTGSVTVDHRHAPASDRAIGTNSGFEPGARTAWHTNPLGQTIIVKSGEGRMQRWGEPVSDLRPGDVIHIEPGVKHWHGASPGQGVTVFTIQEALNGETVEWLEEVTEDEYRQYRVKPIS